MNGKILDDDETIKQLNDLNDENKKLKSENEDMRRLINNISHQRDEFHHGARENANRVGKLKKENEQLKQSISDWSGSYDELYEDIKRLEETLNLIAEADSYTKENSVKEILRREIKAIDTVAGESADAWNDYCLLSNFFEEQYNELWDNYED